MNEKVVLERDDLRRTLKRIAHEITEKNPGSEGLALVGIHTRGAVLAGRLHTMVGELTGAEVPLGDIDISFYRDDVGGRDPDAQPQVHASHLDFDLSGRTVVLVDDVLFTGRTPSTASPRCRRPKSGPGVTPSSSARSGWRWPGRSSSTSA